MTFFSNSRFFYNIKIENSSLTADDTPDGIFLTPGFIWTNNYDYDEFLQI